MILEQTESEGSTDNKEHTKIRGKGFTSPGKLYTRRSDGEMDAKD